MVYHNTFIGVGSNIDSKKNITEAINLLKKIVSVTAISTFYETSPVGNSKTSSSPNFYNGVFKISTNLRPEDLKVKLRVIEGELGRVRVSDKFAPRTIDLDIVLFEGLFIQSIDLTIPDPDILRREFLTIPLLELNPEITIPPTGELLRELIEKGEPMEKTNMIELKEFTENLRKML